MIFNKHLNLEGKHAFLGASNYHWLNYSDEKLINAYYNQDAKQRGTELHAHACRCIELGTKLAKSKRTLNMFVNDSISFGMTPEQILYYSDNVFGTADAISFRDNILRIFDYKSGLTEASIKQLEIYAALFCLEYDKKPDNISIELRIYQSDEIIVEHPEAIVIEDIMDKIISSDKLIDKVRMELSDHE